MQNYVGDLLRKALINLYRFKRENPEVGFNIVLTVYDSIMYEIPAKWVPYMVDVVIPDCMTHNAFTPNNKFHVAVDTDVVKRWDVVPTLSEMVDEGLDEEFAKRFCKKVVQDDGTIVYP